MTNKHEKKTANNMLPMLLVLLGCAFLLLIITRTTTPRIAQSTALSADTPMRSISLLSGTYVMNRLYKSMQGPSSYLKGISLRPNKPKELAWVTGIASDVVAKDGKSPLSQEFFCHANLAFDSDKYNPKVHNDIFSGTTNMAWRLFTLIAGRQSISFPSGFGIPLATNEPIDFFTMSLNQNLPDERIEARIRANVFFTLDKETKEDYKPLFRRALYVLAEINDSSLADLHNNTDDPAASCGPHEGIHSLTKPLTTTSGSASIDGLVKVKNGNDITLHWMVPPGKHTYRTDVSNQLKIPFTTDIHYVTGHLHPFGRALILRDITTNKTIFKIEGQDSKDRLGVEKMSQISLPKGVPIHKDHKYELIAEYENNSEEPVDAMGILYIYMLDKEFKKPRSI